MDINLSYNEQRAILDYLKRHLSEDFADIKHLTNLDALYLLAAYNKLQLSIDEEHKMISYMD